MERRLVTGMCPSPIKEKILVLNDKYIRGCTVHPGRLYYKLYGNAALPLKCTYSILSLYTMSLFVCMVTLNGGTYPAVCGKLGYMSNFTCLCTFCTTVVVLLL